MSKKSDSAGAEGARSQPPNGLACGRACGPLFPAASMGGRAPWPTVRLSCGKERCGAAQRGHARDGFSRSTIWGLHEEFIRLRPGVHRRNGELRPTAPINLKAAFQKEGGF